jgi:hypothetical protein
MPHTKCPDCNNNNCQIDVTEVECTNCDAQVNFAELEENFEEAESEGIPLECPFCERPSLEFIGVSKSCSDCGYQRNYEERRLTNLTGRNDD